MVAFGTAADVLNTQDEAVKIPPPTLTFCYEDKQLLPYYTGNNRTIPAKPGATIEHLRQAAKRSDTQLQLVRLPWLRCLQRLEDGSVDALVAAIDAERAHYTVYPRQANGTEDPSRSINQLGLCLAYRYDNPIQQKIADPQRTLTVSRPLGYKPIPFPKNTVLVKVQSPKNALDLVISGRVDATTVLCQLNGVDAKDRHLDFLPVQVLYPPLHQSVGYLMLSNSFYQRQPQLAEQLWDALPQTLDKERYLQYLNYPNN